MRSLILLLLVGTVVISEQALAQGSPNHGTIEEWAKKLDGYAWSAMSFYVIPNAVLSTGADLKEMRLRDYFRIFPSDFKTFNQIYGYQVDEEGRILASPFARNTPYHEFLSVVQAVIPAKEYYEKMLGVGVGGSWDADGVADGVSSLQEHLKEMVTEDTVLSLKVLVRKEEKEVRSFWRFLYDGPHPELRRPHYERLHAKVRDLSPQMAQLLMLAYEQLLSEYDEHGH